jgi:N-acetylneuraminic acid mutarotase
VLLLAFAFLMASFVITTKPVSAATQIENSWESKAPMQVARAYLGVAVVNGKIYAIGGDEGSVIGNVIDAGVITQHTVNTVEEYNPSINRWNLKSPMPTARARFGTAVYKDKIYCIG